MKLGKNGLHLRKRVMVRNPNPNPNAYGCNRQGRGKVGYLSPENLLATYNSTTDLQTKEVLCIMFGIPPLKQ
jgi:hypothetical protein